MNYPPDQSNNPYPNQPQQPPQGPYTQYPPPGTSPPPQYPQSGPMYPPNPQNFPPMPPQFPQKKEWYKSDSGIILLLVFFFPAGLLLMWLYSPWSKRAKWIITGIIGVIFVIVAATNSTKPTTTTQPAQTQQQPAQVSKPTEPPKPTPTPTPVPAPKTWQTTQTFSGDGQKKTEKFKVADEWKLQWTCDPSTSYLGQYNVIITVYSGINTYEELAVNTICKEGNTSGETSMHSGGEIFLDVSSTGQWSITVQELK